MRSLLAIMLENQEQLSQAISADYGGRSLIDSRLGDLLPTVNTIKH
ncbi:MAG: hypothetical protein JW841_02945 [Deltaproteobacteria bacterium]|nr:hypothetical protein [Deltaproteobacteria bacterium]